MASTLSQFGFSAKLAWRQLTHEKAKLFAAVLGVLFACVLVFMQLGFRDSLYASIGTLPNSLQGDLFIQHKQTEALWRAIPFHRQQVYRALSHPDVERVMPFYIGQTPWKNPETQAKRTLMVLGAEPSDAVMSLPGMTATAAQLTRENTIAFDTLSRPEFGPIAALLAQGPVDTEVNDRRMDIVGTFRLGASFAADGNALVSDQNFIRIFPNRLPTMVDIGIIRVKPGADVIAVRDALRGLLDENVHVFDKQGITDYEFAYWKNNVPIGFIFGFGVVMGLVVGMVIVYQILFTDINNHLNEFATLKAMGYSQGYLYKVVFASSVYLALIGFIPGYFLSLGLYELAESVTYIAMPMPLSKVISVFTMVLVMCILSGCLAMRKMRQANPADMF